MPNCTVCGHTLEDSQSAFITCPNCGSVFTGDSLRNSLPPSPSIPPLVVPSLPVSATRPPKWHLHFPVRKELLIVISLLFIILAGSGFGAIQIWRHQSTPTADEKTAPNNKDAKLETIPAATSPNTTTTPKRLSSDAGSTAPGTQNSPSVGSIAKSPLAEAPPVSSEVCAVNTPPGSLNLNSFYQKYCPIRGFAVISATEVSDAALKTAAKIIDSMTSKRPDVLNKLIARNVRYGVIGKNQQVLDMPEYKDLYDPNYDWNARSRGFGATSYRPLSSSGEENLLCLAGDRYIGESITVHEFSHTFLNMGLEAIDNGFRPRIQAAYNSAISSGKWTNTYAATNADEYWAEGVQDFFDTNLQSLSSDGIHNEIHTRVQLQAYDPGLYNLIAEVLPATSAKITCQ